MELKELIKESTIKLELESRDKDSVLDEMIKYLKKEGFEILPIRQSDEQRNYWNNKLFSIER